MTLRFLLACVLAVILAGCQWLPLTAEPAGSQGLACPGGVPDFTPDACLLDDWIAFGLASQQADEAWRSATLAQLGEAAETQHPAQRLATASVLAWGDEPQRRQASSLLHADLDVAPKPLQPLLDYWLGELEQRRAMYARLSEEERKSRALARRNHQLKTDVDTLDSRVDALQTKIQTLTDIERNIDSRQHHQ